jgi:hypothetical protein
MLQRKRVDWSRRNPGVAASRQSAANCDGNSNGGFLPKAATPKADGAHPQTGRTGRALRIPNSELATDSFPVFILGWTTIHISVFVICMNIEEFARVTACLSFATAKELISQCEREYLLPRQVIARSLGQSLGEPVIFKIPEQDKWYLRDYKDFSAIQKREEIWRPIGDQKKIYLSILSQIVKAMPEKFDEVALSPPLHGTKRAYFGRSRAEVETTGKRNEAAKIPDTERWASVNNAGNKKQKTLSDLMFPLGFSRNYIELISWAPCRKWPAFSSGDFRIT